MTKLYFHAANTSDTGTLPTTRQAATIGANTTTADAVTVNRSMDNNIGISQASLSVSLGTGAYVAYITRFVTPPLGITSIAAQTWNYTFSASETSLTGNFPLSGTGTVNVTVFIWRPSTGAKIATVLDGNSVSGFTEPSAALTQKSLTGTFAGALVNFAVGDILCMEVIFGATSTGSSVDAFLYDGTTETNTNGTTTTSQASHIEAPSTTITFSAGTTAEPMFFTTKAPLGGVSLFIGNTQVFST